MRIDLSTKQFS